MSEKEEIESIKEEINTLKRGKKFFMWSMIFIVIAVILFIFTGLAHSEADSLYKRANAKYFQTVKGKNVGGPLGDSIGSFETPESIIRRAELKPQYEKAQLKANVLSVILVLTIITAGGLVVAGFVSKRKNKKSFEDKSKESIKDVLLPRNKNSKKKVNWKIRLLIAVPLLVLGLSWIIFDGFGGFSSSNKIPKEYQGYYVYRDEDKNDIIATFELHSNAVTRVDEHGIIAECEIRKISDNIAETHKIIELYSSEHGLFTIRVDGTTVTGGVTGYNQGGTYIKEDKNNNQNSSNSSSSSSDNSSSDNINNTSREEKNQYVGTYKNNEGKTLSIIMTQDKELMLDTITIDTTNWQPYSSIEDNFGIYLGSHYLVPKGQSFLVTNDNSESFIPTDITKIRLIYENPQTWINEECVYYKVDNQ